MYSLLGHLYNGEQSVISFVVFQLFQNLGAWFLWVNNQVFSPSIPGSAGGYYFALLKPMHGTDGSLDQVILPGDELTFI